MLDVGIEAGGDQAVADRRQAFRALGMVGSVSYRRNDGWVMKAVGMADGVNLMATRATNCSGLL